LPYTFSTPLVGNWRLRAERQGAAKTKVVVPSDSPALWTFASSCIQLVLLRLVMGHVYSFSGKKEDVSSLITKAKAKRRSRECYFQRTPVAPAVEGAWIGVADFFDWHGRPQDVDLEVYQSAGAGAAQCISLRVLWSTTLPMQRLRMFYLMFRQMMVRLYSRNFAPPKAPPTASFESE
jgi:hypothetical protein